MEAGATHLTIPRTQAGWLGDHPHLVEYFAARHDLLEASTAAGLLFALRRAAPIGFYAEVSGWEAADHGIALRTHRLLSQPTLSLLPLEPARGLLRGTMSLSAERLSTLRIEFVLTRPDRRRPHRRQLYLSLARPGWLMHDLPFVEATVLSNGAAHLEFDLRLDRGRALERIVVAPIEEDNWRLHPMYPGGASFALPDQAPAGARLTLQELALEPAATVRRGSPHGTVTAALPTAYRKPVGRPRDAVLFSSWVPDAGLALGDDFIEMLRRWHTDSKIFVGINHGSSPHWRQRLEASGLDVTVQDASPSQTMPCDPTGFVAALDAYRRHQERFEFVWFGHTKGLGHLGESWYATGRWTIERMFWSRRQAIERHFADPRVGLYAPHYLMMLPGHRAQTDALQRIYQGPCAPLGAMAVSTHYAMRDRSVREFCSAVDPRFFRDGPAPFGGDIYFFEMAMPNVPLMQGYEPFIEPGLGGTSGPADPDGAHSVLNDWQHNNAVVAQELEKWRRNPTRFRTSHAEYREVE